MKRIVLALCILVIISACKKEANSTGNQQTTEIDSLGRTAKQLDGLTLLKGEFLYLADAAVLQTHREVYAVVIDEKMEELNDMVKPYKKEDTDMIPVEIRAKITPKPADEEGWPYRIEIKEILAVSEPDESRNDVIKIGN